MLLQTCISFPHVCNQNPLGPAALRVGGRAPAFSLGGDRMDPPGAWLSSRSSGLPGFVIGHWPVYQPLAFFIWWFKFDAYAPKIFIEGGGIAASGGIAAMAVAIILSVWRAKEAQNVTTYGSARWADIKEVRARGTSWAGRGRARSSWWQLSPARWSGTCAVFLRRRVPGRASVSSSPTPADMAVFHCCPRHQGREFPVDIRLACEVWVRASIRSDQSREARAYNPLLEIRKGDCEVRDAQNIADILVDPEGALERRNHWEKTSHSLLVGAILHVLYAEADKNARRRREFSSPIHHAPIEATLNAMLATAAISASALIR